MMKPLPNSMAGASDADVIYGIEPGLSTDEFIDILRRSTLAERRPIDDRPRMDQMLEHASLIVTARKSGLLVGISRALTDFAYCTYLSDLAVDRAYQRQGIGRQLIEQTHRAAGIKTTLVLLAAPAARQYYPHIGMQPHDSCWLIPGLGREQLRQTAAAEPSGDEASQ